MPTFPEILLAHTSQMTSQLSQSMQIMTSSKGSINAEPATIASESDTERCLAGRAASTATTVMSRSRSQGTKFTIVTGDVPLRAFMRHCG